MNWLRNALDVPYTACPRYESVISAMSTILHIRHAKWLFTFEGVVAA